MSGKLKAVILMIVMFGLGAVSGVAWQTYRFHRMASPHTMFMERRIKRLKKQLHLSDTQVQALRDILQKANARATQVNEEVTWDLEDIHRDSVKAIRQILTPDQTQEFEILHRKFHARHSHMAADDLSESTDTARGARP